MKKSGLRLLSFLFIMWMILRFGYVHSKDLNAVDRQSSINFYLQDKIHHHSVNKFRMLNSLEIQSIVNATIIQKNEWICNPQQFPTQIIFCTGVYMNVYPFKLREAIGRQQSGLKEYTGLFEFADFPSMEIYVYNGDLYGETSHGKSILKKLQQKDTFEIVDYQAKLTFNRDSTSNIISVELDAQGFISTGTKRKTTD
ncbi:hypothetical protein GXP67_30375 [Rhodocytophaga rosea]|uniref:Uncharacterized protein n=1 Tax=Rhodocytophaga rosea TaxID=2704465 RepID=A0A6C0GT90_9BACT|nr:hypothetical protein [Rhodocytophaga rosea]QHT70652.1 hypothetical protein GXP67_30375 [Rhodocytophaga rosea]